MATIEDLEERVNSLEDALTEMAKTNVIKTDKIDTTSNKVDNLTPYTETKTAYIGDAGVVFDNVPSGNLSVFVVDELGNIPDYMVTRTDYVKVVFPEPLNRVTTVTISIV